MAAVTPEQYQYYMQHADDNKQPNLIATIILCLILPCIAVALRFFARWTIRAGYKADDWLILAALAPLAGMSTTTGLTVRYGEGKHIIFVNNPEGFAKAYVAGIFVYAMTVILTKLSILYLYHRIFPSKALAQLAILISALVVTYNAALIIFAFLQCIPLSKLWTGKPEGRCVPTTPAYVALAVMNVITDIMILTLPIKYVLMLQMKPARKAQVLGAFALGGIVCVFGIIRSYYVGKTTAPDVSWTTSEGAIWSQVEISVGIISACLPTYRPLITKRSRPNAKSSYTDYSNSGTSENYGSRAKHIPLAERQRQRRSFSDTRTQNSAEIQGRPSTNPNSIV